MRERGYLRYPMLVVVPNELVGVKARATEPWKDAFNAGIIDLDQNIVQMFCGLCLQMEERGKEPPVLLIWGTSGTWRRWLTGPTGRRYPGRWSGISCAGVMTTRAAHWSRSWPGAT